MKPPDGEFQVQIMEWRFSGRIPAAVTYCVCTYADLRSCIPQRKIDVIEVLHGKVFELCRSELIAKDPGFCTVADSILVTQVVYKTVALIIHELNEESENGRLEI